MQARAGRTARTVAHPRAGIVRLATSEVRTMADGIPLDEFERKAQREHARVASALRDLADRLERLPPAAENGVAHTTVRSPLATDTIDARLRPILQRLLVKRPEERYPSASDTIIAIAAALTAMGATGHAERPAKGMDA